MKIWSTTTFPETPVNSISSTVYGDKHIKVDLKREDLIDAEVSGNKFRKLKYNMLQALEEGHYSILTYGGAFSNHIAAVAKAGKLFGLETIGVIRGEELGKNLDITLQKNFTLRFAYECGMQFEFVTRTAYREKNTESFRESLKTKYGTFYEIPEGGTNELAIKGCHEILGATTVDYDYIACAVGTGGTIAGIIEASLPHQKVLGFPALKGDFLEDEIKKYTSKTNWELIPDYHFGGYAKTSEELIRFINRFKKEQNIQLDPVYTGKMMYGLTDLIRNGYFSKNTRIFAVHTGGLQGIPGMNDRLKKQGRSTISI
ncbi:1-aminocyclopropane-1-carboxylate deaminase/D-cysteine desulfhydrase [Leeuwenhoekiella nanhaiensis]|uniref:1-aminocyclopropane-1-carboxylate deaminase n=1 Tax=Leeuwenhoekiella nanhaiensis TaxID=1655491 RepID=A0A2G1VNH1_9FLAO|nr:pyridoxal-phosphate dependent enzyme [Leeuwenhoekiella nanhaiensis]PHQ28311.1 1-aminocyclopropane-1-carboxylate deaminase [Leeuwenhoekiella nanhaiensis]